MKKMTKREALEKCAAMWDWLAEEVSQIDSLDGSGRLLLKKKAIIVCFPEDKHPTNACFACEYSEQHTDQACKRCPMWKGAFACEEPDSPYAAWRKAKTGKEAVTLAKAVADLARAKLAELPPLKRKA